MKRELRTMMNIGNGDLCCAYPDSTYRNNRSKRARSRDKKLEHQHARSLSNRQTTQSVLETLDEVSE